VDIVGPLPLPVGGANSWSRRLTILGSTRWDTFFTMDSGVRSKGAVLVPNPDSGSALFRLCRARGVRGRHVASERDTEGTGMRLRIGSLLPADA